MLNIYFEKKNLFNPYYMSSVGFGMTIDNVIAHDFIRPFFHVKKLIMLISSINEMRFEQQSNFLYISYELFKPR